MENPKIYEINTRVWIKRFYSNNKKVNLDEIPLSYWEELAELGIDYIWLMGVWKINPSTIKEYCLHPDLKKEYTNALKDWKEEDVIGSPYAIDKYELNPILGDEKTLLTVKQTLNNLGMKLILDFVPNHFSVHSSLIKSDPYIFLETSKENYESDKHTFFRTDEDRYFAHGRDPFYPAWLDTAQVNYFRLKSREYMVKVLLHIATMCDGVRCDMAMLDLNNIFINTWSGVLQQQNVEKPKEEFWNVVIDLVKNISPSFIFVAEAYWDLEWELQQLGFDYTYDKELTDRLEGGIVKDIRDHLLADYEYQCKSVRFIENHDEQRSKSVYGKIRVQAAAVVISTIKGMRFYHDGQTEGKKIKIPVQLGREPEEPVSKVINNFYKKLFEITKHDVFTKGDWSLIKDVESWEGNGTHQNILAWMWKYSSEKRLVVVNYSNVESNCRIKLDVRGYPEQFKLIDMLNDKTYFRSSEEAYHSGIYIVLKPYKSHIFCF